MSNTQQLALSIQPIISYPRQAQVGKTYLMTIDLQSSSDEWLYEEEEYPIYCMLDTSQLFNCQPLGEPAVVLHRFGGSYGAAEFLLTAAQEEMQGEITVTLANSWGMPIRVLSLGQINITQMVTENEETVVTYKRPTSVPPIPKSRRNPYIFGRPISEPEIFFGHQEQLSLIEENLRRGQKFIFLYGHRRMGKSTLLQSMPKLIKLDNTVFINVDLQDNIQGNLEEFLYALTGSIAEQLEIAKDTIAKSIFKEIKEEKDIFINNFLPKIYEKIKTKKLVLLLDDFDFFTQSHTEQGLQLLHFLENLLRQQGELYVIAAVSITLSAIPNLLQFFRDAPVIKIGGLDDESAKQFITLPAADSLKYEPEAIQAIINLSAGYPYFLQALCFTIFARARELEKWSVTEEDVEMIVDRAIEIAEAGLAWYWEALSIAEKVVLSAVAQAQQQNTSENPLSLIEDYGFVITDALEEALQTLINKDSLKINPIKIKVELIRLWLLQRHPLRDEIWQFEIHNPPEPFVGRESEIAVAFEQIYNRGHLAIWGGRGMGKTSFLQKLELPQTWEDDEMDSSQAVIVRFSCDNITPFTPSDFWAKILNLIKDKLPAWQAEIDAILQTAKPTKDSLRQILRKLKVKDKYLVLLIDDFDVALKTNQEYDEDAMRQFLSECRNLSVHSPEGQHMSMIVTSLKRLNELGPKLNPNASPWYNHYRFWQLKPFNNLQIQDFLTSFNKPITTELKEVIIGITGRNPTLLKIASSLIYKELENRNQVDVQELVNELESSTRKFLQGIWHSCSQVEQTLLMLFAVSGLRERLHENVRSELSDFDLIFTQRERELIQLEEQGIVNHTVHEEKNIYSLSSSIMERWIIQELQQTDENWLQAREKVFLNLMSHQQIDKLTTAIKWLWNNQNQIPSNLWFGKLVTAIQQRIEN